MTFRSPWSLLALVVVPAVVSMYVLARRRQVQRTAALAADGLRPTGHGGGQKFRRHVPFVIIVGAIAVLMVALARPAMTVRTPRREATVILAIDVSNSMLATDVKPSRFEAAKTAARAFVDRQPSGVRIGVVAFGSGAVTVAQPTTVHADVVAAITRLSTGGGTSLGQGMLTSLNVIAGKPLAIDTSALASDSGAVNIGYFGSATIVLLSDGENLSDPDPVGVAGVSSVAGVRIQTIGVGTEAGTVVQINGFNVATALDSDLLKQVATASDGRYYQADDAAGLAAITKAISLHFKIVSQHTEITGALAAVAALLLLVGALLSLRWFGRAV